MRRFDKKLTREKLVERDAFVGLRRFLPESEFLGRGLDGRGERTCKAQVSLIVGGGDEFFAFRARDIGG